MRSAVATISCARRSYSASPRISRTRTGASRRVSRRTDSAGPSTAARWRGRNSAGACPAPLRGTAGRSSSCRRSASSGSLPLVGRQQFEDGIALDDRRERLRRRARAHREVALNGHFEVVEIRTEYRRFFTIGDRTGAATPPGPSLPEGGLAGRFGGTDPLGAAPRRPQEATAQQLPPVYRGRVGA